MNTGSEDVFRFHPPMYQLFCGGDYFNGRIKVLVCWEEFCFVLFCFVLFCFVLFSLVDCLKVGIRSVTYCFLGYCVSSFWQLFYQHL
jgi:hypothetical protein